MSSCTRSGRRARLWTTLASILTILAPLSVMGSTFSGTVVTADGMPGGNLVLILRPTRVQDDGGLAQSLDTSSRAATRADGSFRFDAVPAGAVTLVVTRDGVGGEQSAWVRSIDSRGVTFHAGVTRGFTFTLSPGTAFEDVTVTIVRRSLVSGRVLEADGSPVTNARLDSTQERRSQSRRGRSTSSLSTDEQGRYFLWLDDVATHALTVSRGAESATRVFVVRHDGEELQSVDLVLAETAPDRRLTEWIENPANGHLYRLIEEDGWFKSNEAAAGMGAHLVAIEDATELAWLVETYGDDEPYWIGLTDERVEGAWEWVTGEPLDFANWNQGQPAGGPATGADYALMNWLAYPEPRGRWRVVDPVGSDWHRVRKAIVEKPPVEHQPAGIIVTPTRRRVAVAPGGHGVVELVVRNASERERLITFSVAEMVAEDTGAATAVEGAAGLLALVDPDAMAKPFVPWETRTIELRATLPPDADAPRQVFAIFGAGPQRESMQLPAQIAATSRVASRIDIVPIRD